MPRIMQDLHDNMMSRSCYKNDNARRRFFWFHCLAFLSFLFNVNDVIGFISYTATTYTASTCYYGGTCSSSVNLLALVLKNGQHESQIRLLVDDNDDENPHNKILTDIEFKAWLTTELQDAAPPGHRHTTTYKATYDNAIIAIVKWRQRYHGNPAVWKRIFKKDRVFKELIESVPVLHSVQTFVNNHTNTNTTNNNDNNNKNNNGDEDNKITILDLCSGKGYLSMFLSEILPSEKVSKIILIDKAWPLCNGEVLPHHMNWEHIWKHSSLSKY
jgi:hypothetical protein